MALPERKPTHPAIVIIVVLIICFIIEYYFGWLNTGLHEWFKNNKTESKFMIEFNPVCDKNCDSTYKEKIKNCHSQYSGIDNKNKRDHCHDNARRMWQMCRDTCHGA